MDQERLIEKEDTGWALGNWKLLTSSQNCVSKYPIKWLKVESWAPDRFPIANYPARSQTIKTQTGLWFLPPPKPASVWGGSNGCSHLRPSLLSWPTDMNLIFLLTCFWSSRCLPALQFSQREKRRDVIIRRNWIPYQALAESLGFEVTSQLLQGLPRSPNTASWWSFCSTLSLSYK